MALNPRFLIKTSTPVNCKESQRCNAAMELQDLSVRMSASGSSRTTSQDLCMRTSCPRSPCPDLCAKILSYHSSVCGSLVQDLSVRMSASGSSRTTSQDLCMRTSCPRSPCPDLCAKILSYQRISCARSLCQDVCIRIL